MISIDGLFVWDSIAPTAELTHDAFSLLEPTAKIVEDSDKINAELGFTPLDKWLFISSPAVTLPHSLHIQPQYLQSK